MWDGRETASRGMPSGTTDAQALDAIIRPRAGTAPSAAQLRGDRRLRAGAVHRADEDHAAGSLGRAGARGGPGALTTSRSASASTIRSACCRRCPAPAWRVGRSGSGRVHAVRRVADASARRAAGDRARRGDLQHAPVRDRQRPRPERRAAGPGVRTDSTGTCTVCHDTPNAGNHSVAMALNIGIADPSRRTPDLPLYTLRNKATGDDRADHRPGRAMVTGKWKDVAQVQGAGPARARRAAAVLPRRIGGNAGGRDRLLRHALSHPVQRPGKGGSDRVSGRAVRWVMDPGRDPRPTVRTRRRPTSHALTDDRAHRSSV